MFFVCGDVFFCVIEGKNIEKTCLNDTEGRKKTPKGVENTKILKKTFELLGKLCQFCQLYLHYLQINKAIPFRW